MIKYIKLLGGIWMIWHTSEHREKCCYCKERKTVKINKTPKGKQKYETQDYYKCLNCKEHMLKLK